MYREYNEQESDREPELDNECSSDSDIDLFTDEDRDTVVKPKYVLINTIIFCKQY